MLLNFLRAENQSNSHSLSSLLHIMMHRMEVWNWCSKFILKFELFWFTQQTKREGVAYSNWICLQQLDLLTAIGFASRVNGWMHYGFFSFLSVLSKLNKLWSTPMGNTNPTRNINLEEHKKLQTINILLFHLNFLSTISLSSRKETLTTSS